MGLNEPFYVKSGLVVGNNKSLVILPDASLSGTNISTNGNISSATGYITSLTANNLDIDTQLVAASTVITNLTATNSWATNAFASALTAAELSAGDINATKISYNGSDLHVLFHPYDMPLSAVWNSVYTDVNATSGQWNSVYTDVNSTSSQWDSVYADVNATSGQWNSVYTDVNSTSGQWDSVYADVNTNSGNWKATYTLVALQSADWQSTHNVVASLSSIWDSVYADVNATSAQWNSVYTDVSATSAQWDSVYTDVNATSGQWDSVYADVNATSGQWDSVYTDVSATSAQWDSVYTDVNAISSQWDSVYTTVSSTSSNWDHTTAGYLTSVSIPTSSNWDSVYTTVSVASAAWGSGSAYIPQSANWEDTYNTVQTESGEWASVYGTVFAASAAWGSGGAYIPQSANWDSAYTTMQADSASWESVYGTVQAASAAWGSGGAYIPQSANWDAAFTAVQADSAGWDSAYSTVRTESGEWASVYDTVQAASATWNTGGAYLPQSANWEEAYGWGDHATAGYVTSVDSDNWDSAYSTVLANSASWSGTGGGGSTGGITPFAFVAVDSNASGTGVGISWIKSAIYPFTYALTFDTPQPDAEYTVLTDHEGRDDIFMQVSNKTTVGFNIDSFDDNGPIMRSEPTIVMVYSSTPGTGGGGGGGGGSGGTGADLTGISGNWESTYSTVYSLSDAWGTGGAYLPQSANWDSAYTTVNTNSGDWGKTDLTGVSADWQSTYTTVSSNSANWGKTDLTGVSSNWESAYATVNANSGTWGGGGVDLTGVSGNWENTYTKVDTDGTSWDSTYSTVLTNSANWNAGGYGASPVFIVDVSTDGAVNNLFTDDTQIAVDGRVPLLSAETDGTQITFEVEWDGSSTEWTGYPEISGVQILKSDSSALANQGRRFTGTAFLDLTGYSNIVNIPYVFDGITRHFPLKMAGLGPQVQNIQITSVPPHSQTHYKDGDTIEYTVEFDTTDVASIDVNGSGSVLDTQNNVTATMNGLSATFTGTVNSTNTSVTTGPIKLTARNAFGTQGPEFISNAGLVSHSRGPIATGLTYTSVYPFGQTNYKTGDDVSFQVEFDTTNVQSIVLDASNSLTAGATKTVSTMTGLSADFVADVSPSSTTATQRAIKFTPRSKNSGNPLGPAFTASATVLAMNGPVITNTRITSAPPHSQDHWKDGDNISFDIEFDTTNIGLISLDGSGAANGAVGYTDISSSMTSNSGSFTTTIDVTTDGDFPLKITPRNKTNGTGQQYTSTTDNVTVPCKSGPVIQNIFVDTNDYPGSQTELKSGDTVKVQFQVDTSNIDTINLDGQSSTYAHDDQTFNNLTYDGTQTYQVTATMTIGNGVVNVAGDNPTDKSIRARARKGTNSYGAYKIDAPLPINNQKPALGDPAITYSQYSALGSTGTTASVGISVDDEGSSPAYLWSSPDNSLTIANPTNYVTNKTVTWNSTSKPNFTNTSSNVDNVKLRVTRTENNTFTEIEGQVLISAVTPTVTLRSYSGNTLLSRMRSGGNDGTTEQTYQIRLTSDEPILIQPTLTTATNKGTIDTGTWSKTNSKEYRVNIKVHDDHDKGTHTFQQLSVQGIGGVTQTSTTGQTYVFGGFVSRDIPVQPAQSGGSLNVLWSDYSKLTFLWSADANSASWTREPANTPIGTGGKGGGTDAWCIQGQGSSNTGTTPTSVTILSVSQYSGNTSPSTITIEETL